MRHERRMHVSVEGAEEAEPSTAGTVIADAPSTMTAWTGVLAGPFADRDDGIEQALSTLQAELDEKGRQSQYEIHVETGEYARFQSAGAGIADARTTVTAWIGVVVGILAPIVVLLSTAPSVGLAATLAFVLAGVGPGVMCWVDAGDPYAQAALTFVLGLAAFALATVGMIWLAAWHPTGLLLLAVPSVLSCLCRLYYRRGARRDIGLKA